MSTDDDDFFHFACFILIPLIGVGFASFTFYKKGFDSGLEEGRKAVITENIENGVMFYNPKTGTPEYAPCLQTHSPK